MLGYISGKILEINENSILILTESGLGYEILINELSFSKLAVKEETELYLYHHITEGHQTLFGFLTLEEKKLFTELLKISGIGGKAGLQILMLGKERLIEAVQGDDGKTIESIKGIGKKMAEKIILELKDKDFVKNYSGVSTEKTSAKQLSLPPTILENIKTTLQNMGYQNRDIERVLQILPENYTSLEEILPFMIREL
ncbi:Holliday junction branch migration protein RuvA [Candidatus Gracilibacteria bacterium]|nr:Holliday junction branch migration protein RuvA [Candidatus Gracilibacteria bacterium]